MRRWKQVLPLAAVVVLGLVAPAPSRAAVEEPVLVVDGRGFGHGVGMAQEGAYWMGRSGSTLEQILGHFYPGVGMGTARGNVRVVVLQDADRDTVLTFPQGGEVRSPLRGQQAPGFPLPVPPGGAVRVRHDGTYRVSPAGTVSARSARAAQLLPLPGPRPPGSSTTTTAPASTTTTSLLPQPDQPAPAPAPAPSPSAPPSGSAPSEERTSGGSVWAVPVAEGTVGVPDRNARYRGVVEAALGAGGLRLLNEVDVEQYLRGMGEVRDPSWPAASLQAQAVAARTYALRAMRAAGEICDTQRCQVYLGRQAEYGAMDRAVAASAGKVLVHRGTFAAAVYSANGGGISATPQEGFGTSNAAHPYLQARPYETQDPDPWQVRIALRDLAPRLGYRGALTGVRIASAGPSGRPLEVALDGDTGSTTVPAREVAKALGLRSTLWQVSLTSTEPPPPPPPAELVQELEQELPEDQPSKVAAQAAPSVAAEAKPDNTSSNLAPAAGATLALLIAAVALLLHRARRHKPTP